MKRTKRNASELSMIPCLQWQAKEYGCDERLLSFAEYKAKRGGDCRQAARESGSIAGQYLGRIFPLVAQRESICSHSKSFPRSLS